MLFEWTEIIFTWGGIPEKWQSLLGLWLKVRIQKSYCTLETEHLWRVGSRPTRCVDLWLLLWFEVASAQLLRGHYYLFASRPCVWTPPPLFLSKWSWPFFCEGTVSILGFMGRTVSRTLLLWHVPIKLWFMKTGRGWVGWETAAPLLGSPYLQMLSCNRS